MTLMKDSDMKAYPHTLACLLASAAAIGPALAAEPGPACAPVLKAMSKTLLADHATATQSEGHTLNGITAGAASFDAAIDAVPEPLSVSLLGGILLFSATALRRKLSKTA